MSLKRNRDEDTHESVLVHSLLFQNSLCSNSSHELSNTDCELFNGIKIPSILPPITPAAENCGPRIVIDNIVVNNFKSFRGETTIGPFHKVRC